MATDPNLTQPVHGYPLVDGTNAILGTAANPLQIDINATSVTFDAVNVALGAADAAVDLNAQNLTGVGGITCTGLTDSGLTSGRVVIATTGGLLANDADLTFSVDTLSATKVASSSLTSGRVVIAGTAGLLGDDSDLTFSGDTLTATNISSGASGTITAGSGGIVLTGDVKRTNVASASVAIGVDATAIAVGAAGAALTTQAGAAGAADATTPAGASGALTVSSRIGGAGSAAQIAGASGAVTVVSGNGGVDGGGGGAGTGDVTLDAGAATGAGTAGEAKIGRTGANAVRIGRTTKATTVYGTLNVAEATTLDGAVTLGNASGDDVTVTGHVAGDVTLKQGEAHILSVAATVADSTAGAALTIRSGTGGPTASNSGDLTLDTGAKVGGGTDGTAYLGTTNANAVSIGRSGKVTTVNGTLAVTSGITANTIGKIFSYTDLAASGVGVHAAVAGNAASNDFPGPFTNPAIPRAVQIVFGAGWDGGDVTVTGTDWADAALVEVVADNPGNTVQGVKLFKTTTGATKQTVGSDAATATIQTGDKIGIVGDVQGAYGLLHCDGTGEAVTVDATYDGFVPTTAPNGAHDYVLFVNVTHNHAT